MLKSVSPVALSARTLKAAALASFLALSASSFVAPAFAQLAPAMGPPASGFADLVDRVKPAVVSIQVKSGGVKTARNTPKGGRSEGIPGLPDDHPLNDFFKNLPKEFQGPDGGAARPSLAQGSGFIISSDGYVVTNNHVIEGGGQISVSFDEKNKFDADLVGTDSRTDVALLKIKSDKTFPFVKFAEKLPRVGDYVIAVGNPFGFGGTVTAGIVSALGRDIGSGPYDYMQIDAAVNRGNSGGPTFNQQGEVIGVNTAIFSPSGGSVGVAFAIPAKTASEVVTQLKSGGPVKRGWLGVKIQNIDEDTAASLGLNEAKGALISEVTAGGPAQASGLKTQDAILSVNGEKIGDSRDLARKVAEFSPDTLVDVKVLRAGKEETIKVKLGTFPSSKEELAKLETGKPVTSGDVEMTALGLMLSNPPAGKGGKEAAKDGVTIADVDTSSDAALKGLKAGDVIVEINGQKVATAADVEAGVKEAQSLSRKAVRLSIRSGDQTRIVPIQLAKKG